MQRIYILMSFAVLGTFLATAEGGGHHRQPVYYYPAYAMPVAGASFQMQAPADQIQLSDSQMRALSSYFAEAQAAQALKTPAAPLAAPARQMTADDIRRLVGEDLLNKLVDANSGDNDSSDGSSDVKKGIDALRRKLLKIDELDSNVKENTRKIKSIREEIDTLKDSLAELSIKVHGKTPAAVKKALDSEAFKTSLKELLPPDANVEEALKKLKDKLEGSLE